MTSDNFPATGVSILGSTGSIGVNTCNVIRALPGRFRVIALCTHRNVKLLAEQVREFRPLAVAIADRKAAEEALELLKNEKVMVFGGPEGLVEIAAMEQADIVVSAIVGAAGLLPTIEAVKAGKTIALANKEVLVTAGEIVTSLARDRNVPIIPVDSEHSALFQCMQGEDIGSVRRLILTASGGPFLNHPASDLDGVSLEQALSHPRWEMGNKITIDSATMMNKGFEVIEAHWLFGVDLSKVDVVIHPQSIIHSMVEFHDGAILAQMGEPDMKVPIQYALTYPQRAEGTSPPFDFMRNSSLTFAGPDREKFPCLDYAYEAARVGGTMPAVLNAANEAAVGMFLKGGIGFTDIPRIIRKAMDSHSVLDNPGIDDILRVDREVRKELLH